MRTIVIYATLIASTLPATAQVENESIAMVAAAMAPAQKNYRLCVTERVEMETQRRKDFCDGYESAVAYCQEKGCTRRWVGHPVSGVPDVDVAELIAAFRGDNNGGITGRGVMLNTENGWVFRPFSPDDVLLMGDALNMNLGPPVAFGVPETLGID